MRNVAVIGGGAAGMMAAYAAAKAGCKVTLFEHNEKLGKKLFITGKGRCNVTNAGDTEDFFAHVVNNPKFLYSAIYQCDAAAVRSFFEGEGLPLKVERGERVFPQSDHSSDVIRALERALRRVGVKVLLQTNVVEILTTQEETPCVSGLMYQELSGAASPKKTFLCATSPQKNVMCDVSPKKTFSCDAIIVATGGVSYPSTGSDGSGFQLLSPLGHSITKLRPALVALKTKEPYIPQLQGLSLRNVSFCVWNGKKKLFEDFGELLFTHQGISGPLVLTCSSCVADRYWQQELAFTIDLKPSLSEEQLDKRIQRDFEEQQNRQFKNALGKLLPAKLIPVVLALTHIDQEKQVHQITKEERHRLMYLLKHFPGTITGLCDWKEAIITRGGVSVKEVSPSTMESKKVAGLYICGEMLDVDALTGGYNLQIAWSTGFVAGTAAAEQS